MSSVIHDSFISTVVTTTNETISTVLETTPSIKSTIIGYGVSGGMSELIYDPDGYRTNIFNLANIPGNLDGGTFN